MTTETINMIEHLTKSEIAKLNKMVLGYGRFKYTAAKAGLSTNTLRNIISNGYGLSDNVRKIREQVLGYGSKAA